MGMRICKLSLLITILVLILSTTHACAQQAKQNPSVSEESRQIEQYKFTKFCQDLREDMRVVNVLSSDIANYSWTTFGGIGIAKPDQYGIDRYTLTSSLFPSSKEAKTLTLLCNQGLSYSNNIASNNPYEEPTSIVGKLERIGYDQWYKLCDDLKYKLSNAKSEVDYLFATAEKLFSGIENSFKLSNEVAIREKYSKSFQSETSKYKDLLGDLKPRLSLAEQNLISLMEWKFTSLAFAQDKKVPVPIVPRTIFKDDFSEIESGWCKWSSETREWAYEDGEYSSIVKKNNWIVWCTNENKIGAQKDCIIEVSIKSMESKDAAAGIIFRQQKEQGKDSYYVVEVNTTNGIYQVSKNLNGEWSTLKQWTESKHIMKENNINRLRVSCEGPQIEVFVNGFWVTTVIDESLLDGHIGLVSQNWTSSNSHYHFDDLKIYTYK
jgi:hypothetical protein